MDDTNIDTRLLEMEALVLDALRSLSEAGDAEALRTNPREISRHEEALAHLGRVLDQFERLTSLVDATPPGALRH